MKRVPLEQIRAGMVLAKPIMNESGMVLLSDGTALSDSLITRLGRMDISHVYIEGVPDSQKPRDEMLRELDERFKKTEKEPHMDIIKRVIRARIEEVYQ